MLKIKKVKKIKINQKKVGLANKLIWATGLRWWLSGKESTCHVGDTGDVGLIPGSERSPGGGQGDPLQYSCLENPMDRGV